MKIIMYIYFIFYFLFSFSLKAAESNQVFVEAVKDLRVQLSVYNYEQESLNPFKSSTFLNKQKRKSLQLVLDDPLRSASLESYKLAGLVWETKVPKAIIKDPEGKTHILKKGDYLGDRQGQIISIREGEVVVLELIEREGGEGTMYKTNVLTFSELFIENKNKNKNKSKNRRGGN